MKRRIVLKLENDKMIIAKLWILISILQLIVIYYLVPYFPGKFAIIIICFGLIGWYGGELDYNLNKIHINKMS